MYYLGIAFKDEIIQFMLIDEQGYIHGLQKERHVNLIHEGLQSFRGVIEAGIARICLKANIPFNAIDFNYIAVPGYGENSYFDEQINIVLKEIFIEDNYICENDVEAALTGALSGQNGITILVETGSVAIGKNHKGDSLRVGGWGQIAGDEAGEYWLAEKTLEIFTKEADGRYKDKVLYDVFKRRIRLNDDLDIMNFSFEHLDYFGIHFDVFLTILEEAYELGDSHAKEILEACVHEYVLMIKALINQMSFNHPINISYIGRVFKIPYLLDCLNRELDTIEQPIIIQEPILSLITGAALKALMFRKKVTFIQVKQLFNEEKRLKELQM